MRHPMPLSMAIPGEVVRVIEVRAGRGLCRRVADMGLVPGTKVRVLNSQRPGPVLLDVKGTRLALGHGMAHKVWVER